MKYAIYLFLIIFFSSCERKEIVKNSPEDIETAENFVKDLYEKVSNGDTTSVFLKLDNSINNREFKDLFNANLKKSGLLNKLDINRVETERVIINKANETIIYKIELTVYYQNLVNIETLGLIKQDSESAKIFSYYFKPVN
ncbi:hypothetical protein [Flavobacterium tibetense]|uniref:DUF3887 domain-containing protein n=1 Tax=Flavobacterium tibetense TaxID=2233533 RepID=A0A365P425_9FLAO|nr:hypothetical protein [Flavobacterium tibetense]RBA29288.1 hypothetical protein DPN68_03805 [Flavobacterium tibetense]